MVFYALKRYVELNANNYNNAIVINCPEADNVTILLLKYQLLSQLINGNTISLYCSVQLVDAKPGKPTKKPKKQANIEEFKQLSSKIKMNFYQGQ